MFGGQRKVVIAIVTGILGMGARAGAARAPLAPAPADTFSLVPDLEGASTTSAAPKPGDNGLKAILDALVTKGVITQAQEDAILAAAKDAHGRDDLLRRVFGNLFDQSAIYLGLTPADLKTKLPGTSLAAIANATAGKSRDGLIATLATQANAKTEKALQDAKVTAAQATELKAGMTAAVTQLVDRKGPAKTATGR